MNAEKLRGLSLDELKKELLELLKESFKLRIRHSSGDLKNTSTLKKVRRNIARVLTILHEKKVS